MCPCRGVTFYWVCRVLCNRISLAVFWGSAMITGVLAQDAVPQFQPRRDCGQINLQYIDEASGLTASRCSEGVLWTHNDSGGFSHLFAIDTLGQMLGKVILVGVHNRDWEDMDSGPGPEPGKSYLYVADIGDNDHRYATKTILRLEEPGLNQFKEGKRFVHDTDIARIRFKYPDGQHNAETLMCHPRSGNLYIITKAKKGGRVYRLRNSAAPSGVQTAEYIATVPIRKATGGAFSPDGHEILVKNYFFVYYWGAEQCLGETVFHNTPALIPYVPEPQGEAICFDRDGKGFYTLSESRQNSPVHLYYYAKNRK